MVPVQLVFAMCALLAVTKGSTIEHKNWKRSFDYDPSDDKNPLGKAFNLHTGDIYMHKIGGNEIFKNLDSSCTLIESNIRHTKGINEHYENTERFYKSTATNTQLSLDIVGKYTMGATLGIKTSSISAGSVDIKGYSLGLRTYIARTVLMNSCYRSSSTEFVDGFVRALENLPLDIRNPKSKSSWSAYQNILDSYGSHIVTEENFGSFIRVWSFAKTTYHYTLRQFEMAACFSLSGVTQVGQVSLGACSSYSSTQMNSASNYHITTKVEVVGGTDATRNSLIHRRTASNMEALMNEARDYPQPIDYKYKAIWDIIKMKYAGTSTRDVEMRAKAETLRQYYEGYLDFNCTHVETYWEKRNNGGSGWMDLRWFAKSRSHTRTDPKYECRLAGAGCRSAYDCHSKWTASYCYGPQCVEWVKLEEMDFGEKAMSAKIRTTRTGSYGDGINQTCDYHHGSSHCRRDLSAFYEKTLWSS